MVADFDRIRIIHKGNKRRYLSQVNKRIIEVNIDGKVRGIFICVKTQGVASFLGFDKGIEIYNDQFVLKTKVINDFFGYLRNDVGILESKVFECTSFDFDGPGGWEIELLKGETLLKRLTGYGSCYNRGSDILRKVYQLFEDRKTLPIYKEKMLLFPF